MSGAGRRPMKPEDYGKMRTMDMKPEDWARLRKARGEPEYKLYGVGMDDDMYWQRVDRLCSHFGGEKQEGLSEKLKGMILAHFDDVSSMPIASGSLSLIFSALQKNGQKVAIKVLIDEACSNHKFVSGFIEKMSAFCVTSPRRLYTMSPA
jgi:hypothetical protein